MSKTLALIMISHYLKMCWGAIDTGVIVFGATVGPNFQRPEGMGRYSTTLEKMSIHQIETYSTY